MSQGEVPNALERRIMSLEDNIKALVQAMEAKALKQAENAGGRALSANDTTEEHLQHMRNVLQLRQVPSKSTHWASYLPEEWISDTRIPRFFF